MTAPSFTFEATEPRGDHVTVIVRCGEPGQRALLGRLVMRATEWLMLRAILAPAWLPNDGPDVVTIGEGVGGEQCMLAVSRAMRAAQRPPFDWTSGGSLLNPRADVAEYCRTRMISWTPYDRPDLRGGMAEVEIDGVHFTVHGVRDRFDPAPLPECGVCGSTAAPTWCPCGFRPGMVAVVPRCSSEDDEISIPF